MSLSPGTRLGPYEVAEQIGAGGMGEVYRATDTNLRRQVALKVLPMTVASDTERLARFQREAQVLAALSHQNIAGIYGLERAQGTTALVMELVEGPTLADRLVRGPIPLEEALPIARQIAEALEAAHDLGIVHRDLKPANIKVRADGVVKVLDFGLAKALEPGGGGSASGLTASPTLTTPAMTQAGMILGTAAYMSPEQARGQEVDRRADIWAFGVVLLEMLVGRHVFSGDTVTDVLAAVVRSEPDWDALPGATPAPIRRLLRRCLEKDRARRLPAIGVARLEIDEALSAPAAEGSNTVSTGAQVARARTGLLPWGAVVLLTVALGVVWVMHPATPAASHWTGESLGGPDVALEVQLSPDGQTLAFQALVNDLGQLAVMKPESGNWQVLTRDRSRGFALDATWSLDGTRLYFARYQDAPRGVYSVPVLGGDERLVLEDAQSPNPLPDGSLLVVRLNAERRKQLYRYSPETGALDALPVLVGLGLVGAPVAVAPDGERAAFLGTPLEQPDSPAHVYALDLRSGRTTRLAPGLSTEGIVEPFWLRVSPDGASALFSLTAGDAYRVVSAPMDGSDEVRTVVTVTSVLFGLSPSADGSLYVALADRTGEAMRLSGIGAMPEHVFPQKPLDEQHRQTLTLSNGRVLFNTRRAGELHLMIAGPDQDPVPFVQTQDQTATPVAMVGQAQAAFVIGEGSDRTIGLASVPDGRLLTRLNGPRGADITSLSASPDGGTLYYTASGTVWSVPVDDGMPRALRPGDSVTVDPNRNDLIVLLNERESSRLIRVPLDGTPEQPIPVESGVRVAAAQLHPNAVGPDGRILVQVVLPESWYWPAALLDPESGAVQPIDVGYGADMPVPGWTPDGDIAVSAFPIRSTLWRLRPDSSE